VRNESIGSGAESVNDDELDILREAVSSALRHRGCPTSNDDVLGVSIRCVRNHVKLPPGRTEEKGAIEERMNRIASLPTALGLAEERTLGRIWCGRGWREKNAKRIARELGVDRKTVSVG
jgi:hypothetical protein